jgi:hypothetical protein
MVERVVAGKREIAGTFLSREPRPYWAGQAAFRNSPEPVVAGGKAKWVQQLA